MICPYCDGALLVDGMASPGMLPSAMAPFQVTSEQAVESLRAHCWGKRYLAKGFEPRIERIRAVFVPFLLCDTQIEGEASTLATATYVYNPGKYSSHKTHRYFARAVGTGEFKDIPLCLSGQAPDALMRNVAPFDTKTLGRPSAGCAKDVPMEVNDSNVLKAQAQAHDLARDALLAEEESAIRGSVPRQREDQLKTRWRVVSVPEEIVGEHNIVLRPAKEHGAVTHVARSRVVAMPIWLLSCTWHGRNYSFCVNGQTGVCVGNLPVNKKAARRGEAQAKSGCLPAMAPALGVASIAALIMSTRWSGTVLATSPSDRPASAGPISIGILICIGALVLWWPLSLVRQALTNPDDAPDWFVAEVKEATKEAEDEHAAYLREVRGCDKTPDVSELTGTDASRSVKVWATASEIEDDVESDAEPAGSLLASTGSWVWASAYAEHSRLHGKTTYTLPPVEDMHTLPRSKPEILELAYRVCEAWHPAGSSEGNAKFTVAKAYGELRDVLLLAGEFFVAVSFDGAGLEEGSELALTDMGILERLEKGAESAACFTSWEELAWARTCKLRGPDSFVKRLRSVVREACPWEAIVGSQPLLAASIAMGDLAREACESHPLRATVESGTNVQRLLNFSVRTCGRTLLAFVGDGKDHRDGFALTETGFVCLDGRRRYSVTWEELSMLDEPTRQGSFIRAGGQSLAFCDADGLTIRALLDTCCTLHARACEVYGTHAEDVLLASW